MKQKKLSNLEEMIMDIVWNKKLCSVHDVRETLIKQKNIAYTTVATILQRLEKKGFVKKRARGIANLYEPKISKEVYSKKLANSFLSTFMKSFGNIAIVSFADSIDKLSPQKREYLLKLLKEHDKNK